MPADLMLLPPYFKDIHEYRILMGVEGEELDSAEKSMGQVKKNLYVQTCDDATLQEYEQRLGIVREPGAILSHRRRMVLSRMNQQLPYSLPKLKEILDAALGENGYRLHVRYEVYELELDVIDQPYETLKNAQYITEDIIPGHLLFIFAHLYPSDIPVDTAVSSCLGLRSDFYARYNRVFLYLDGSWGLDGTYAMNGYKELGHLDLYPARLAVVGVCGIPHSTVAGMSITSEIQEDVGQRHIRVWAASEARWDIGAGTSLRSTSVIDARPESDLHLKVEKDLWYLDGTYLLDGEKLLDAQIIDYEL